MAVGTWPPLACHTANRGAEAAAAASFWPPAQREALNGAITAVAGMARVIACAARMALGSVILVAILERALALPRRGLAPPRRDSFPEFFPFLNTLP